MKLKMTACALALGASSGCDLFLTDVEGVLPPRASILIPNPGDREGSEPTRRQPVCDDGNDIATAIVGHIANVNDSAATQRELIEALYAATPTGVAGVANYDVEAGGTSMNVTLVPSDTDVAITASLDPGGQFITGSYKKDGSEGTLTISPEDRELVVSTWGTADGGGFDLKRVEGAGTIVAAYTEDGDNARLGVVGTQEDLVNFVAIWNRGDGAGAAIEGLEDAGCWSEGDAVGDLCNEICDETLVDELPQLPDLE
jgi:hypothetical protein